jgi:4-methylaminobutanoate oxidase (formaldehyde-forming)
VRSASYGFTLGGAVGLAMVASPDGAPVDTAWLADGQWSVRVGTAVHPAIVSARPLYDPQGLRLRG